MNTKLAGFNSLLAGALVATALITGSTSIYASSEAEEIVAVDTDGLETIFWTCDYAAATHGVDGNAGILCASATDELKMKRFGGSFERLLEWWHANKAAQHAALHRAEAEKASTHEISQGFPESI